MWFFTSPPSQCRPRPIHSTLWHEKHGLLTPGPIRTRQTEHITGHLFLCFRCDSKYPHLLHNHHPILPGCFGQTHLAGRHSTSVLCSSLFLNLISDEIEGATVHEQELTREPLLDYHTNDEITNAKSGQDVWWEGLFCYSQEEIYFISHSMTSL